MKREKEKMQKKIILHNTGMVTRKEIKHMRMPMRISITYKPLMYISMTCMIYDAHIYDTPCVRI